MNRPKKTSRVEVLIYYKEIKSRVAKICPSDQLTSFSWRSIPICLVKNNSLFTKSSNLTNFQFENLKFVFVSSPWKSTGLSYEVSFIPTIMHTTVCWLLVISKIHFKKPCSMKRENNFLRLTWFYIMKTSTTPNSDVYLFWYFFHQCSGQQNKIVWAQVTQDWTTTKD